MPHSRANLLIWFSIFGLVLTTGTLPAQRPCEIEQITQGESGTFSGYPSLEGSSVAFQSGGDPVGTNPDGNVEIFLYDGSAIRQMTHSTAGGSGPPTLDGESIAFASSADLVGRNPDGTGEIFLYDGASIQQITDSKSEDSFSPSLDGGSIAFASYADLDSGRNPDANIELFLYDGTSIQQITDTKDNLIHFHPSLDRGSVAFTVPVDLVGDNPDLNSELFLHRGNSRLLQVTRTDVPGSRLTSIRPSLDNGVVAFESVAELGGRNRQRRPEIFLFDGSPSTQGFTITQVTRSFSGGSVMPSLDGRMIAFASSADFTGENPDGNVEIFLYDGSSFTQVTDTTGKTNSSWMPSLDGASIAFSRGESFSHGESEVFLASCPCLREDVACVQDDRFRIEVEWKFEPNVPNERPALVSDLGTADSAIFYFDDPANLELLVKVLNGCSLNDHYWVFLAGTTDVEFTLTVTDRATGVQKSYSNPQGSPADAVTDTAALPTCF